MQWPEVIERTADGRDWLTLVVFIWMTLLAYVRMSFPLRFKQFTGNLVSEQYVNLYAREERWLFNNFNIPIGVLFFTALAFVTIRMNHFYEWWSWDSLKLFAFLVVAFLSLYLLRTGLLLFLGRLFRIETTIRYALLRRYSNAVLVSGIWFAFAVISLYLPFSREFTLYIGLASGALMLLWGYLQIFRKLLKQTRLYFYYLILYICALEIAPILLIAKWLAISN